jgi:hypothetical protein
MYVELWYNCGIIVAQTLPKRELCIKINLHVRFEFSISHPSHLIRMCMCVKGRQGIGWLCASSCDLRCCPGLVMAGQRPVHRPSRLVPDGLVPLLFPLSRGLPRLDLPVVTLLLVVPVRLSVLRRLCVPPCVPCPYFRIGPPRHSPLLFNLSIRTRLHNIGERCKDPSAIQAFSYDGKYLIKTPFVPTVIAVATDELEKSARGFK